MPTSRCRGSGGEKPEFSSAIVGNAVLSALALCSLSSPPTVQSSDCFRHAQLWPLSPSPCKKHETKETPLPSASDERWGGDLSHSILGFQWYFSMRLEYLSGSDPGNGFLLPADCSLVATLCGHLGLRNRPAETPKDLGVMNQTGESRMGISRWGLSVQPEASGANCSALFARGNGLSGNMWAQSRGAHLAAAQERAHVVGQPCQMSGLLSQPLVLCRRWFSDHHFPPLLCSPFSLPSHQTFKPPPFSIAPPFSSP